MGDDTQILKHVATHHFWEYFLVPSVWRELSTSNLTPWVDLLYELDLSIFGLKPVYFYLHHLVAFGLLNVTAYYFLRTWLCRTWSFAVCLFFTLSPCYAHNVYFLMTRHYVEGLIWSLLAIIFYLKALKTQSLVWACLGALFYLIATLCKEIYVPLIILLPVWPRVYVGEYGYGRIGILGERLRYFSPFIVIAAIYCFYRRWMLGNWIAGYGNLYPGESDFSALLVHVGNLLLENERWLIIVMILLAFWGMWEHRNGRWGHQYFAFLILLLVVVPLAKISGILSGQHLFLPTFLLLVTVSMGLQRLWHQGLIGRLLSSIGVVVLFFGLVQANQCIQKKLVDISERYSVSGLFMWNVSNNEDVLFVEAIPLWYFNGLSWLKTQVDHREEMAQPIIDACYFMYVNGHPPRGRRFWRYDPCVRNVVLKSLEAVEAECKNCQYIYRSDISLKIQFWQDGGLIRWKMGPYQTGKYFLVDPQTGDKITVPSSGYIPGKLDLGTKTEKTFDICYVAPKGWVSCSTWTLSSPKSK